MLFFRLFSGKILSDDVVRFVLGPITATSRHAAMMMLFFLIVNGLLGFDIKKMHLFTKAQRYIFLGAICVPQMVKVTASRCL